MNKSKINNIQTINDEIELIDFRIYEDRDGQTYEGIYGINIVKVNEINEFPQEIFETPGSPDYMLGMFDLRGSVLPLIDLACWMNIKPKENIAHQKKVIVTEFNNQQLGFVAHDAKRLRRVNWANIESGMLSLNNETQRGKITGTTRIEDGRTLLILDLESILEDLDFHMPSGNNANIEQFKPTHKFEGTVLILDDSSTARKLLQNTLKDIGFEVVDAIDGKAGLECLEKLYSRWGDKISEHLKLIISDVEMPKMNGFHFAAQVKNDIRFKDIPLIFNSSISDKFSATKGKEMGAEAYLVKFDTKLFYDEISRILLK